MRYVKPPHLVPAEFEVLTVGFLQDSFEDAPEGTSGRTEIPSTLSLLEGRGSNEEVTHMNGDKGQQRPSHSRQATAEKVPAMEQEQQNGTAPEVAEAKAETAPTLSLHEAIPSLPATDAEKPIDNAQRMSGHLSPDLKPADRSRSVSPTRSPDPPRSPPKLARGLSGDLSADLRSSATSPPPVPGGLARTASTRIAGFFRMGTIRKSSARSPPAQDRFTERSQSIASVTSAGGDSLATIEDNTEDKHDSKRPTLQDQFQTLRKQAERNVSNGSIQLDKEDSDMVATDRTASDAGIGSPTSSLVQSPELKGRAASTPGPVTSPRLDPSLPPGTASGLNSGPAADSQPVDWDLWQSVIYEGPAAVARTSGEELNQAIASGIPAAIRGVVWQVLADSKNPELEDLYRDLKARGTGDAELQPPARPMPPSREVSQSNLGITIEKTEKESDVASSRSSVHSEQSTAPTSTMASQTSPPPSIQGDDAEVKAALLAEKTKREAAALSKLEKAIKRDLGSRTSFSKYTQAAGLQDGLFGVCKAYALFDEGVGYAQGINFIAMPLLFNMTEEEAFTLLARLMSKYDLRSMFIGDLSGLHLRLYQFERALEDHDPALYCHLRRRNVGPQLYATQWFLTLFAYRFPLQLVLRVYDLLFSQGLTAILKFGLVLMQKNRQALLEMKDMGHITNFLKEKLFDVYIDKSPSASSYLDSGFFGSVTGGADKELYRADEMVRDACAVEISEATLAAYTAEYEESQRLAHDKVAQLDNLRITNTNLAARVKTLEERTQQQDNEHVAITGDFVRNKVENDRLQDENEVLKIKVEELQRMVDTQPAEMEAKFQEEMARIMQRNSEVQSENRLLKEEQEEMEQQLVQIKMKHAEVSSVLSLLAVRHHVDTVYRPKQISTH